MKSSTLFSCITLLAIFALEIAESQLGYSRNWFGLAIRNNPIEPMCLPDDSPCERLTDCCSNWCHPYRPVQRCEPSPCGCPQPPWTPEPIAERCITY
ncbi:unnamed protein product [Allacma fusca]|uniref:Uncharacterized protein n=1 Tax=Allacma fusca TaxID=39272 RepID=A0A8J2KVC3_9HEXA|nr:unnamed protein product [Allacma fusca]